MTIPAHIKAWMETPEGFAAIVRIISETVFDPAAPSMTNTEVAALIEAECRRAVATPSDEVYLYEERTPPGVRYTVEPVTSRPNIDNAADLP